MRLAADIRTTLIALSNLGFLGVAHGGCCWPEARGCARGVPTSPQLQSGACSSSIQAWVPSQMSGSSVALAVRQRTPVDHDIVPPPRLGRKTQFGTAYHI